MSNRKTGGSLTNNPFLSMNQANNNLVNAANNRFSGKINEVIDDLDSEEESILALKYDYDVFGIKHESNDFYKPLMALISRSPFEAL
eukprot:CAMPEP_0116873002 /NCGR_PEP_ID=MMETSP0463-20121206/3957_1 /TAXON_ID=181622 /ORGANISM="Strombidinopsis sp, Strain SopsisLIS2011" /LENGTH=86 /DNA_ID=CAMNT_0004514197 /DNA_START=1422 /DNA_END=1682 /DNA_ORIENTATION=-